MQVKSFFKINYCVSDLVPSVIKCKFYHLGSGECRINLLISTFSVIYLSMVIIQVICCIIASSMERIHLKVMHGCPINTTALHLNYL